MINYQTWTKKKFWLIMLGVFILGGVFALGAKPQPKEVVREVPKEVVREVVKNVPVETVREIEICSKESQWRQLKTIDDEGFKIASDGFYAVSDIFNAIANEDAVSMNQGLKDLKTKTGEMDEVATQRQIILNKLGY